MAKGKLSPLLIKPESRVATLRNIQRLLDQKYPGFHLTFTDVQDVYLSSDFLYARNNSNLCITFKLLITYEQKPLNLYSVDAFPVPINKTSQHATHLLNLPAFFAVTDDEEFYVPLAREDLLKCKGTRNIYCQYNLPLTPATTQSYELGLFSNKMTVHALCNFRFVHDTIKPKILELNPSTILIYRTSLLSLECGREQRMVNS